MSRPGSTANLISAAQMTAAPVPSANAIEPPKARSPFGESNKTKIAANNIADAPFGHAVTTQKSSTTPSVINARAALTRAGSQSGTRNWNPW